MFPYVTVLYADGGLMWEHEQLRYLREVSNIEQVEGLKQFTLFQMKLLLTNSKKRPDVLQAQELKKQNTNVTLLTVS